MSSVLRNIGSILNLGTGEFQNVMYHELGYCGLHSAQPAGWTSDELFDPHQGQKIFTKQPDQLLDPPSHLFGGYQNIFPWGEAAGE